MKPYYSQGDIDIPEITLNKEDQCFEFKGKSLPEDVRKFYNPVLDWFEEYMKEPLEETVISFKLTYLNTASTKMVIELIYRLKKLVDVGKKLRIIWFYESNDFEMKKSGEDLSYFTDFSLDIEEMEPLSGRNDDEEL